MTGEEYLFREVEANILIFKHNIVYLSIISRSLQLSFRHRCIRNPLLELEFEQKRLKIEAELYQINPE